MESKIVYCFRQTTEDLFVSPKLWNFPSYYTAGNFNKPELRTIPSYQITALFSNDRIKDFSFLDKHSYL